jgi:hypothetical protein
MKILLVSLIPILIASCAQTQVADSTGDNRIIQGVTLQDTIVTITRGEKTQISRIKRDLVRDIDNFLLVYTEFNDTLEYSFEDSVSITGTGRKNRYTTSITPFGDGFLVSNRIWESNSIIWYDTMLVNDRFQYYWDDSVFYALKPNSQFYIAYEYFREFVQDPLDTNTESGKGLVDFFLRREYSDSVYWKTTLADFDGRLISNLSSESAGLYIWDKRLGRFIDFYQP